MDFVYGICVGACGTLLIELIVLMVRDKVREARAQINAAVAALPQEKKETYGHPESPVDALYKRLPPPPTNHAWEIAVVPYKIKSFRGRGVEVETDSLALECSLLNITNNEVVDSKRVDLIWESIWQAPNISWDSWREQYERWPQRDCTDLLRPLVRWANTKCDQMRIHDLTAGEYRLKAK